MLQWVGEGAETRLPNRANEASHPPNALSQSTSLQHNRDYPRTFKSFSFYGRGASASPSSAELPVDNLRDPEKSKALMIALDAINGDLAGIPSTLPVSFSAELGAYEDRTCRLTV